MNISTKMTALANVIRTKTNQTELLTLDEMETAIAGIPTSQIFTGIISGPIGLGELPDIVYTYTNSSGSFCEEWVSKNQQKTITILANTIILVSDKSLIWEGNNFLSNSANVGAIIKPLDNFII